MKMFRITFKSQEGYSLIVFGVTTRTALEKVERPICEIMAVQELDF
ncbi:hypothetical protein GC1_00033 [Gluconobacter phage GC1]|uniref:Uncharacterized protein n=1 Tax=Gluconobacter phage GC1 TaxID=2047788 RepID=A0A2I5AR97_9VIRU|nr:hypothetical protein FDJ08_gp33 [Gluconobacter phage GC1]ATS92601.1 hypothetical protein GC1_00033 [Gluconobacter phage GC1]